jgi:hypothetical protein
LSQIFDLATYRSAAVFQPFFFTLPCYTAEYSPQTCARLPGQSTPTAVPPSSSLTLEEGTDIVAKAPPWQKNKKRAAIPIPLQSSLSITSFLYLHPYSGV